MNLLAQRSSGGPYLLVWRLGMVAVRWGDAAARANPGPRMSLGNCRLPHKGVKKPAAQPFGPHGPAAAIGPSRPYVRNDFSAWADYAGLANLPVFHAAKSGRRLHSMPEQVKVRGIDRF